ncbi:MULTISPECIES: winged helix-turn-helix domain-containing protein [unclassified Streptomyces]|uniref:winged helix-turn-helix domain-containing protein n=1 Tax=unclassified Streptomyces TaxID=2593676 RepID=UPI0033AC7DEF
MVSSRDTDTGDTDTGGTGGTRGRAFHRVYNALLNQLTNGTYQPGDLLPPQRDLADEYGVARDTVRRVLDHMAKERWISTRQGSGSKVLRPPSGTGTLQAPSLDGVIRAAFEQPEVSLDVYNLTSETLGGHIRVQAGRIVSGEITPRRVSVRMLLPSTDVPLEYPRAQDPGDSRVWERFVRISQQRERDIRELMEDLSDIVDVSLEIRKIRATPEVKLYVFNDAEMLYGYYEVVKKDIKVDDGSVVPALDVLGLGLTLHYSRRQEGVTAHESSPFASRQAWFESRWNLLGQE